MSAILAFLAIPQSGCLASFLLDDQHEMVSTGWSNPTPWNTHREEPDEILRDIYRTRTSKVEGPHM